MKTGRLLIFLFASSVALAQTVTLQPAEALRLIFKGSKIVAEQKTLTPSQQSLLEEKLDYPVPQREWNFYIARTGKKVDGYALVDQEIGKTEPITFITAINPTGEVREVEILVYREAIGSEVHEPKFLKQFRGKQVSDPMRVGRDVVNVTGATLSSRAVSRGVKRALALWELFYGQ